MESKSIGNIYAYEMSQKIKKRGRDKKNSNQENEKTINALEEVSKASAMATSEKDTKSKMGNDTKSKTESEEILKRLEDKLEIVNKKIDDCIKLQEFNFNQLSDKLDKQEGKLKESNEKIENLSKKLADAESRSEILKIKIWKIRLSNWRGKEERKQ